MARRPREPVTTAGEMNIGEPRELLHETDKPGRATFLELFFDLVYVFALTQISSRMIQCFVRQGRVARIVASELAESLLLLLALWFLWSAVAWTTSRYDPQRLVIQAVVVVALFGSMVIAVALPRALSNHAQVFATAYVITRMSVPAILALALRGLERRRLKLRMLSWLGLAAVPWIAGSLVEGILPGHALDAGAGDRIPGRRVRLAGAGPRAFPFVTMGDRRPPPCRAVPAVFSSSRWASRSW